MRLSLPPRDEVKPDTPLRLSVAAALAFPDGSMTASGEVQKGLPTGRRLRQHIACFR